MHCEHTRAWNKPSAVRSERHQLYRLNSMRSLSKQQKTGHDEQQQEKDAWPFMTLESYMTNCASSFRTDVMTAKNGCAHKTRKTNQQVSVREKCRKQSEIVHCWLWIWVHSRVGACVLCHWSHCELYRLPDSRTYSPWKITTTHTVSTTPVRIAKKKNPSAGSGYKLKTFFNQIKDPPGGNPNTEQRQTSNKCKTKTSHEEKKKLN